jgi:hypothetical protein
MLSSSSQMSSERCAMHCCKDSDLHEIGSLNKWGQVNDWVPNTWLLVCMKLFSFHSPENIMKNTAYCNCEFELDNVSGMVPPDNHFAFGFQYLWVPEQNWIRSSSQVRSYRAGQRCRKRPQWEVKYFPVSFLMVFVFFPTVLLAIFIFCKDDMALMEVLVLFK